MNDPSSQLIRKQLQKPCQDYEQRGWMSLHRAVRVIVSPGTSSTISRGERAVFHCACMSCFVKTLKPLYQAISALSKLRPDAQACRKRSYCSWDIWLVPNGRDGLTMMFPEDYRSDHQVSART